MIPWLRPADPPHAFPPVTEALAEPNGLLCAGGDVDRAGALRGVPARDLPVVLDRPADPVVVAGSARRARPREFRVSRNFAKSLRNRGYEYRTDTAFDEVVNRCGDPSLRPEGTWITPQCKRPTARCTGSLRAFRRDVA